MEPREDGELAEARAEEARADDAALPLLATEPRAERSDAAPAPERAITGEIALPYPTPAVEVQDAPTARTDEELALVRAELSQLCVVDSDAPFMLELERLLAQTPDQPLAWPFVERRREPRGEALIRAVNVAVAAVALVLLAPLMVLVAIAVRLDSPGPVIYKQERVGLNLRSGRDRRRRGRRPRNGEPITDDAPIPDRRVVDYTGRPFTMYKFRSMRADAESTTGAVWAQRGDPRVTRLGRFLRASRLDELPQLWNVLRGDMNIVGPRPERPTIVTSLARTVAHYPMRHRTRPGITGWAQIHATYDACLEDVRRKVRYDLEYLRRRSVRTDLVIMLRTIPVMIAKKLGW